MNRPMTNCRGGIGGGGGGGRGGQRVLAGLLNFYCGGGKKVA